MNWKPIHNYEGYGVSTDGEIRGVWGRVIRPHLSRQGYLLITLYRNKKRHRCSVHRLVASAFIREPNVGECVNHKNSIRTDNRVENLEWCTPKENIRHSINNGRFFRGRRNKKLAQEDVQLIRKQKGLSSSQLALNFGVSAGHINKIRAGTRWEPLPLKTALVS